MSDEVICLCADMFVVSLRPDCANLLSASGKFLRLASHEPWECIVFVLILTQFLRSWLGIYLKCGQWGMMIIQGKEAYSHLPSHWLTPSPVNNITLWSYNISFWSWEFHQRSLPWSLNLIAGGKITAGKFSFLDTFLRGGSPPLEHRHTKHTSVPRKFGGVVEGSSLGQWKRFGGLDVALDPWWET